MVKLLSGYIRKQAAKLLGPHVLPATLIKQTAGTRTSGSVSAGTNPTSTSYGCKGFVSDYADGRVDGNTIQVGDREVTLLGGTLPTGIAPKTGDKVTIADFAGAVQSTYVIVGPIKADADGATYSLQVRR